MQPKPMTSHETGARAGQQSSADHLRAGGVSDVQRDARVDQGKDRLVRALNNMQRSVQTEAPDSVMHGDLQAVTAALAEFKQARSSNRNAHVRSLAPR